ncbi:MAG: type VI secretion system tube protein TssD [bacterium]|jgi:type VI secretion system secreted protein Hcp
MALNAYLKMKGQKSGVVKGSCTQKGREDLIMVHAYTHEIVSPRDAASGLPTGKRMHKALTITKEIDKSSPVLYSILVNNENVSEFELMFWRPQPNARTGMGSEVQFYTIKLLNANIANMHQYVLDNKFPANMPIPPMETVSFTYQKITWTWNDGGITAEDDWETPVV